MPTVVGVWLMSPSVRLPRVEIAGWRHACRSLVAPSGWWCGWLSGVVPRGVGVGWMHPFCVTKGFVLVHCWVSGAACGCSCWALAWISHVVVVGCVWGLCCVRTV